MITHLALAFATFIITNIDDLLILSVYFASSQYKVRNIIAGQYLGIAVLIAVSLLGIVAGQLFAAHWVSLLGLLPVFLGVKELLQRDQEEEAAPEKVKSSFEFFSVALVTIANGGDNIGVYAPLFANTETYYVPFYIFTFLVLTGGWCFLGYWIVRHPIVKNIFSQYGKLILPVFLIVLGMFILKDFIVWIF
jgi:cadmium resistance protein CadD (predicted permease)